MNMKRIAGILSIIFFTSLLSGCFLYEVRDYNNPYDPDLTDGAMPIPYAAIQLDGDTSEWSTINTFISDQINENTGSGQPMIPGGDIESIKIAQDDENLYFLLTTANGSPMETPGIHFHMNLDDQDRNISIQPLNISYSTGGSFGYWSYYNYLVDMNNDIWSGYELPNIPLRFPGLDTFSTSIEFGVSKTVYWDLLPDFNNKLRFHIDTWYEGYDSAYGDGGLDWLDGDYYLLIKGVDELPPSYDVPIVKFGRPSVTPIINGNSTDFNDWNETGYWYKDIANDDSATLENNCDINEIYIKQDNEFVYVLITFNDAANFDGEAIVKNYNIIATNTTTMNYNLNCSYNGAGTWTTTLNGIAGGSAASVEDGYLEIQFDKSQDWNIMNTNAYNFRVEAYDSGGILSDEASFMGSYKGLTDPPPA